MNLANGRVFFIISVAKGIIFIGIGQGRDTIFAKMNVASTTTLTLLLAGPYQRLRKRPLPFNLSLLIQDCIELCSGL